MRELLEKIAYIAIRSTKGNVYFFDEEGIYRRVSIKEGKEMKLKYFYVRKDGRTDLDLTKLTPYITYVTNKNLISKAIGKLIPGDEIEKFEEYLKTVKLEARDKPKGLDRFITKIQTPCFVRKPENTKTNTFDYIYVDVNIVSEWEEERKGYIEKNFDEICKRVIGKLEESKKFQKYGVPVNFLNARITLTKSSIVRFVFELKNVE